MVPGMEYLLFRVGSRPCIFSAGLMNPIGSGNAAPKFVLHNTPGIKYHHSVIKKRP